MEMSSVMKKPLTALIWAMLSFPVFSLVSCTSGERTVEDPVIGYANTYTLDIARVELTDTSTVLSITAKYIPRYWIKISSDTYLSSKGRKYRMTGTDGIEADSLFWMPDSGKAAFRLMFEPLPRNARSFDFIESDAEGCFRIFDVDLTGKASYSTSRGIPAELAEAGADARVPGPEFRTGRTTVRLHLPGYRPEFGISKAEMYVNTLLSGQETYTAPVDQETGTAEFSFMQYGPAIGGIVIENTGSDIWLSPGEELDVYFDPRVKGWNLYNSRERDGGEDGSGDGFCWFRASGKYAELTNSYAGDRVPYGMSLYSGEFADYRMTADEYTDHVISIYNSLSGMLSSSGISPLMKELGQLNLKQQLVTAIAEGDFLRKHNYMNVHDKWELFREEIPYRIDPIRLDNFRKVLELVDIGDPALLMGSNVSDYISALTSMDEDLLQASGEDSALARDLRMALPLASEAADAALSEEDIEKCGFSMPFYEEALKSMQEASEKALALAGGQTEMKVPDVPDGSLFDAIIAPYRGKVIVVDFWNTWCAPCRAALEANEPLKDSLPGKDDIVWIYIANTTSPLVKYRTMIPGIRGLHYRLEGKQWAYLCDKFAIDGIPSYVLVDRDGSYSLRNDFRDHDVLKETLEKMTGKK